MNKILRNIILCTVNKHFPLSKTGRPATSAATILDELLHMLWSGCPWRALRCKDTSFQTVHRHFIKWSRSGVFKEAYAIAYKLQSRPTRRNLRFHCIDSSFVKNIYGRGRDCIGRNPTDRGRFATKVSALVDQHGLPVALSFFPANRNDVRTVKDTLLTSIQTERGALYADKGYDSRQVRTFVQQQGYTERIGRRKHHVHRLVNRRRNVVERFFSWLDKSRRLILRYDAMIVSYESWTWLACIRLLKK